MMAQHTGQSHRGDRARHRPRQFHERRRRGKVWPDRPGAQEPHRIGRGLRHGEMSSQMTEKVGGEKLLYCSFCGKSQHEVRKLIAGPSVFICDECIDLCNDIIREEAATDTGQKAAEERPAQPARDLRDPRPVRDRPGPGQEDPLGRGLQPLQAAEDRRQAGRRRARQVQHPADRAHGLGQDAARADARAPAERPLRDRRCDHAHRSRLRRRGRREHHPEAACRSATTTSRRRSAASSTSTRSTRSRARATTLRSPATFRARACSRRCSS